MNTEEINKWTDTYINIVLDDQSSNIDDSRWCAVEKFFDLDSCNNELCWLAIKEIVKKTNNKKVLGCVAAGPLEDLLESDGDNYIGRIEEFAKENTKFLNMLNLIWKSGSNSVWAKIEQFRNV